ncbi:MAG: hypothetical protein AAGC55_05245 [Myxococcota bacterium]
MEGIRDGRAVDDCFRCALLYPGDDDCQLCGRRMRYMPATLVTPETIAQTVRELTAGYTQASQPAEQGRRLARLLAFVHRHGEVAQAALDQPGGRRLDQLRSDFDRLEPHVPMQS